MTVMKQASTDGPRRRAVRVPLDLEGQLRGRQKAEWGVGVLDVSETGCLVRCPSSLSRGEILDLRLPLGEETFHAKVQVADSSVDGTEGGFLVGLRFFGLAAKDEASLRSFLDGRRRRPQAP